MVQCPTELAIISQWFSQLWINYMRFFMDYLLKAAAIFEKVAAENKIPVSAAINVIRQVKESEQHDRDLKRSTPEEAEAIPPAVQSWWESAGDKDLSSREIAKILGFPAKQGNLTRISNAVKLLTYSKAA